MTNKQVFQVVAPYPEGSQDENNNSDMELNDEILPLSESAKSTTVSTSKETLTTSRDVSMFYVLFPS